MNFVFGNRLRPFSSLMRLFFFSFWRTWRRQQKRQQWFLYKSILNFSGEYSVFATLSLIKMDDLFLVRFRIRRRSHRDEINVRRNYHFDGVADCVIFSRLFSAVLRFVLSKCPMSPSKRIDFLGNLRHFVRNRPLRTGCVARKRPRQRSGSDAAITSNLRMLNQQYCWSSQNGWIVSARVEEPICLSTRWVKKAEEVLAQEGRCKSDFLLEHYILWNLVAVLPRRPAQMYRFEIMSFTYSRLFSLVIRWSSLTI